ENDGGGGGGEAEGDELESMGVIRLPENVDFVLSSSFKEVNYDNLDIRDLNGSVALANAVASMKNVQMKLLDGTVSANGSYDTKPENPLMDMEFGIVDMDIQKAAGAFNTIEKLAPIARNTFGEFSTNLNLSTALDQQMSPIYSTITGFGRLLTDNVEIKNFAPLTKLSETLKISELAEQQLNDVKLTYRVEDGEVIVDPFTVKLNGVPASVEGSMGFDQKINYSVKMDMPMDKLPGGLDQQAGSILGSLNNLLGSNVSMDSTIPVNLSITGTMADPKIGTDFGDLIDQGTSSLKDQATEVVKEELNEQIDNAKEEALAEAREQADQIMEEARQQSAEIMSKANEEADSLRSAGYAEADKLENKGANFLEKAANKKLAEAARKETDKKVNKLLEEAQSQADGVVEAAQTRADGIIEAAENQ
ncbi:MAG: AsmA-like C-terminal region-containing protein, partial [Bacteroidota bacterium]